jgi:hypothetical protein
VSKSREPSPVDAVQAIFSALEKLSPETRERVIASALSLLGMSAPVPQQRVGIAASSAASAVSSPAPGPSDIRRPMSIVELMQDKQPATNPQKIALFAYYRERYENQGRFSRADLKTYFAKAKEPPPKNYDRDFNVASRQGWVHEDGQESYLTSKGLEQVEAGFAGKGAPRGRVVAKHAKKKRAGTKK